MPGRVRDLIAEPDQGERAYCGGRDEGPRGVTPPLDERGYVTRRESEAQEHHRGAGELVPADPYARDRIPFPEAGGEQEERRDRHDPVLEGDAGFGEPLGTEQDDDQLREDEQEGAEPREPPLVHGREQGRG